MQRKLNYTMNLEDTINQAAKKISSLGLEVPAALFLEMHLPLVTLFHTTALMLSPLASPIFGAEKITAWSNLLTDRSSIELLIKQIEFYAAQKKHSQLPQ